MIKNQWYVAADASEIGDAPVNRRLCGLDFVLFRAKDGSIACLSDICIHRGASLSRGLNQNGEVECPYHGWRFGKNGRCTRIPSLGADAKISPRARVDSYPVQEKYGWVWVFLGDLPEAERPPLPVFEEWEKPQWRKIRGEFKWNANYARIVENGIDPSHAAFVHPSFGDREKPEIHDFDVDQDAHSAYATVTFLPPDYKGMWKMIRPKRSPVVVRNGFHVSGAHVRIEVNITKSWKMVIFDVNTPIDETTTLTRWIMARNFMTSSMFDADSTKRTLKIFLQDQAIMEHVTPELLPTFLHEEVSVKSDAIMVAWRNKRRELIEKGWSIDIDAWRRDEDKRALVMPCPARANPEESKEFLLRPVPFKDGATVRDEAVKQRHGEQ
jgi:phenylpropionate dioxygenase-like ring-hydroxylating dioxygenase large terminal subunit